MLEFFVFAWLPFSLECFELDTLVWSDFVNDDFFLFVSDRPLAQGPERERK